MKTGAMKTAIITIEIPIRGRVQAKRLAETVADILDDSDLNFFVGPTMCKGQWCGKTRAQNLGIDDCVVTIRCGKHIEEVTL